MNHSQTYLSNSPSSKVRSAPVLTRRGLTTLLALMCFVPVITISWLQLTMPPVRPGELKAEVALQSVPPASYYELPTDQRTPMPLATIIVKNTGDEPWTHINVRINRNYQIYEHNVPLQPGQARGFLLDRFVSRTGSTLNIRAERPKDVEINSRLPDGSRATFEQDF